jgi:hypothetical protein
LQFQLFQGTSIGALIGGLYAKEVDLISSSARASQFSGRLGNIWRMLSDVTYPLVAYTTVCYSSVPLRVSLTYTIGQGHEFNRSLYKVFYDLHIEDMWLPFFCNTANITTSRMEIHETGYAWRFIRKSLVFMLFILVNSPSQALRCRLWASFLPSVIMETCSWMEGTVSGSLCDRVLGRMSHTRLPQWIICL